MYPTKLQYIAYRAKTTTKSEAYEAAEAVHILKKDTTTLVVFIRSFFAKLPKRRISLKTLKSFISQQTSLHQSLPETI
jgi:hypothetical protein